MPTAMLAALAASALAPEQAQPAPAPALTEMQVSPEHEPAALDALLAARDYSKLGQRIAGVRRQADLRSDLDWLKARMLEGNSAWIAMLYSRLLWVGASGLPEEHRRNLRQTAVMAAVYAMAAITVDGTRCGDRSAPAHRREQLMMEWNPEIWRFAATLTPEERDTIAALAVKIEQRTAARRDSIGDVDFLCRAGMEETAYNLRHGTQKEDPPKPGQIGRRIVLTGDGRYVPSQRPEAEWRKDAAAARTALPAQLAQLLNGLAAPAGAPK
jgi:hypothetical protein